MLTEMLANLFAILDELPDIEFSEAYLTEFLNRTAHITYNTCLKEYEAKFPASITDTFWLYHRTKIRNYLEVWPRLTKSLLDLISAINFPWAHLHGSSIGLDDLLPILIDIMPRNANYTKYIPKLELASKVNRDQESTYYFLSISAAIEAKLNPAITPLEEPDNQSDVARQMQDPNYSSPVILLLKFNDFFHVQLSHLAGEIYTLLSAMNIIDYNFVQIDNSRERLKEYIRKVYSMGEMMEKEPICTNQVLVESITKFLVYCDLKTAINNNIELKHSPVQRLIVLQNKIALHRQIISQDFDAHKERWTEPLCRYLSLPWENEPLITFFGSGPKKYSLTDICTALNRKTDELEDSLEKQRSDRLIIQNVSL